MKKVRYLAGLAGLTGLAGFAGLAPAAAGMLIPAAAHAGPAHQSARSAARVRAAGVKTVSLRRTTDTAVPAAGCAGEKSATAHAYSLHGDTSDTFWYTPDGDLTCIGTVLIEVSYSKPECKTWNVHINGAIRASKKICASSPAGVGFAGDGYVGIHTYYSDPVQVCVGAANTVAYPCKTVD